MPLIFRGQAIGVVLVVLVGGMHGTEQTCSARMPLSFSNIQEAVKPSRVPMQITCSWHTAAGSQQQTQRLLPMRLWNWHRQTLRGSGSNASESALTESSSSLDDRANATDILAAESSSTLTLLSSEEILLVQANDTKQRVNQPRRARKKPTKIDEKSKKVGYLCCQAEGCLKCAYFGSVNDTRAKFCSVHKVIMLSAFSSICASGLLFVC